MMRWEYCDVTYQPEQVIISFCRLKEEPMVRTYEGPMWPQLLARLGEEGWEMIGCMSSPLGAPEYFFYFERVIAD